MNNTTIVEDCVVGSEYDQLLYLSNIIWRISGLLSVIFGVPGHCFEIILSSVRTNRQEPTSLYYIAIAICELTFLLGLFWLWCAHMSIVKNDPRKILSCGVFYGIIIGSTTLSNLYLASMSIDRSVIIIYPTRYRSIVTKSHVRTRVIFICIIVFILLIPHHFYFSYEPKSALLLCAFNSSVSRGKIRLWALTHAILLVSIPSIIVCICTLILLRNRCKHQRNQQKHPSVSARRMQRQSMFIFFVSLGIFLCLLPSCILEIFVAYDRLFDPEKSCSKRWKIYKILLHCFLILTSINYSMKFYLHLTISTSFRKDFLRLINWKSTEHIRRHH